MALEVGPAICVLRDIICTLINTISIKIPEDVLDVCSTLGNSR